MEWWAWIAVGAVLLGSELAFIDAQFYLVFVGAPRSSSGFWIWRELLPAVWLQWLVFARTGRVFDGDLPAADLRALRRKLPDMKAGPAGETVVLPAELPPGESCRLEYRRQFLERGQRRNIVHRSRRARAHRSGRWPDPGRACELIDSSGETRGNVRYGLYRHRHSDRGGAMSAKTATVVPQQSAFVIEHLGKYSRTLSAGFHILDAVHGANRLQA